MGQCVLRELIFYLILHSCWYLSFKVFNSYTVINMGRLITSKKIKGLKNKIRQKATVNINKQSNFYIKPPFSIVHYSYHLLSSISIGLYVLIVNKWSNLPPSKGSINNKTTLIETPTRFQDSIVNLKDLFQVIFSSL